jgi:signal transduction histidine kinase
VKALNPRLSGAERTAAVDEAMEQMRRLITGMAGALGTEHLLVSAATRYMAQVSVMLGQQRQ